jgi:polygalacturonase
MDLLRRDFLKWASVGLVAGGASACPIRRLMAHEVETRAPFNIRSFGAIGDGTTVDTPAVNRAIATAAASGGGTVLFPAGTYPCHSVRLKSHITLRLEPGAVILAAPAGGFDAAESNAPFESFQDFGHNHWHNSLIWGEGIDDVAICGPGLIWGRGLSRGEVAEPGLPSADAPGAADKVIALKRCQNVTVRDIAILAAGHFAILATGVDDLTLEDLRIDTNRDGINVDGCRKVRIAGCRVNSPWDDGICLKSSFALGEARATENVTISNCYVTGGFALGAMLDGSLRRAEANGGQPTGRIKCGTESNGGFKNITISDCIFESCRGFALESVDGGPIEDVIFRDITMRDIRNAPFFLRLGARLRGPIGIGVGTLKRVMINNITCDAPANDMPAIIAGIPDHSIEDISVRDVFMRQKGGAPAATADIDPPEQEREYPEPSLFGSLPAQALMIRHARNVEISHLEATSSEPDPRPSLWLGDVDRVQFSALSLSPPNGVPSLRLREVSNLQLSNSRGLSDTSLKYVRDGQYP